MTPQPIFDVRRPAVRRAILRLIIAPALAIGLIVLGYSLVPDTFVWALSMEAVKTADGWAFVGIIMIISGLSGLVKEVMFAYRSWGSSGEWRFRLTRDELLWHVPDHAHGPEVGFEASLCDIQEIEFRTIRRHEASDEREYWVHFRDRDPVQLKPYSGVSVSSLVSRICEAGVRYTETIADG